MKSPRFHYVYVRPFGETDIEITEECDDEKCGERFHLTVDDRDAER